ncbi:TonB-dependent receptor family protein [Flavihumibacter sp. UBA7668]|uniref:TonB-dependent receptor family protein n=1 Tax=Flavihumibacter sp. UBA7668 TaxID=1946542 RepID=UPI0025BC6105|nr:TonB-dependent receptor [Flavihumibacter sp. UBA7668]
MKSTIISAFFLLFSGLSLYAQEDSSTKVLDEFILKAWLKKDIARLPETHNGFLFSGRKNEVIHLGSANTNMALKTGRQIFAKVPGVFVYDMDGSGNQINISTRGLDPHRSWEFNIRQNGVLINSDMYGYPASHYSPPMEAYEQIELVRGTGSLQYGAQFGGMVNYLTKTPDSSKLLSFESINMVGSYDLLSSYNAVSGTYKKFSYYAYYYRRHYKGYRKQSESDAEAQYVQLNYAPSKRIRIKAELGRSTYLYKIPGPLTDSMFHADPQMATRDRNYFSPDIYVPSITVNWTINKRSSLQLVSSAVLGTRNSVMFDAFANIPDTINQLTGEYKNRQVDIDRFNSKTTELRFLHQYRTGSVKQVLASGAVVMINDLNRRQLGKGTSGSEYDLSLVEPGFGRDMHFKTKNLALFLENAIEVVPGWTITPGWRMETGQSDLSGKISYYTEHPLPTTIKHNFHLFGLTTQLSLDEDNQFYAGINRAYRPVIFKDIVPASTYEQIDKNLKNATGYNAEAGVRGKLGNNFSYDLSLFRMVYENRLGTIVAEDNSGQAYTFKTNIGNSRTNGVEAFVQYRFQIAPFFYAGIFSSSSYMNGVYTKGELATGIVNTSIKGKNIESVPEWISRNGLELMYRGVNATILYNYTSGTYSDALNTVEPPANGARGYTPAYSTWDINISVRASSVFSIRAGINNLTNRSYFTKRPAFYPGPGIWPADGRNVYLTIGVKI